MIAKMNALNKNGIWEIVDLPEGKQAICLSGFNPDDTIQIYKARLVAKCSTWTYGVDYFEIFCPIAK